MDLKVITATLQKIKFSSYDTVFVNDSFTTVSAFYKNLQLKSTKNNINRFNTTFFRVYFYHLFILDFQYKAYYKLTTFVR